MLTSRRDYILRIIDEVGQILARVIFKRRAGADQEALETVLLGCERLFGIEADQIFLLPPERHYAMLVEGETPEIARDKVLLYAALNAEAGRIYTRMGKTALARASFTNALRFTIRARVKFPAENLPDYAPKVAELVQALAGEPLDADTAALLRARPDVGQTPPPFSP